MPEMIYPRKVTILTDGSRERGFGHVTRCLSFYQAFKERGMEPVLFVDGGDDAANLLKAENFVIRDWKHEQSRSPSFLKNSYTVVVDSYEAGIETYENISESVMVPVYLDDMKRLDYPRGIIVNGAVGAQDINYKKDEDHIYLLGNEYAPLRREFWDVPEKEISEHMRYVMVTLGGTDAGNLTPRILSLLSEHFPYLLKIAIIGKGFQNCDAIRSAADPNTQLRYAPGAGEMRDCMLAADLAIAAGGQTLYELARIGVPTIAIAVAENQLNNVRGWEQAGFIEYAGYVGESGPLKNINECVKRLMGRDIRLARSGIGRHHIDGKGALRVVDRIINCMHSETQ